MVYVERLGKDIEAHLALQLEQRLPYSRRTTLLHMRLQKPGEALSTWADVAVTLADGSFSVSKRVTLWQTDLSVPRQMAIWQVSNGQGECMWSGKVFHRRLQEKVMGSHTVAGGQAIDAKG